ncbi:MAG: type I 3-dehydroquinate dehydratase [Halobacteriaceae archaeon]
MEFDEFVLAAATADLATEPRARDHADAVEFRMDLATSPLDQLRGYDGDLPVLATNRVVHEGGESADDDARLDALVAALDVDAVTAVDLELSALRDGDAARVVDAARDRGAGVVVSVHDFEATPPRADLAGLLTAAADRGDVGKLAVWAHDRGDVLDLLAATHERDAAGDRVATMAMGEAGRHSRAVAPLYGSRIGYAPVDPADATAPGQYDLATLDRLVGDLRGRDQTVAGDQT